MKLEAASVEQGREVDLRVKVNKAVDFAGEAKMTLIGLPNRVTTSPVMITKNTTEAVFHLKTDAKTPPGETKSLFCQVLGDAKRRADSAQSGLGPPARRRTARQKKPATSGLSNAVRPGNIIAIKNDPNKPLSRLEKLRLESKAR